MFYSILSCPVPEKLPYLIDMTWSSRSNSYIQVWAGGRKNNVVTLKEINRMKSHMQARVGLYVAVLCHGHRGHKNKRYAICDSLTLSLTVAISARIVGHLKISYKNIKLYINLNWPISVSG